MGAAMFSVVWGRTPPIEVTSSRLVPETVAPGSAIHIERMIRRVRPGCGRGVVTVTLVDSHRVIHRMEPLPAPSGRPPADGVVGATWPIPDTMPEGESIFRSFVTFSCYPFFGLWPVTVSLPDEGFVVQQRAAPQNWRALE